VPENPWLSIPAADYEGHMGSPAVGQLAFLGGIFRERYARLRPARLLLAGCTTGNGLEHVDPVVTRRVVGVDLNPEYLRILRERHAARLPGLKTVRADLGDCDFAPGGFDWIHCALLFEYLEPGPALARLAPWLAAGGVLTAVLQLADDALPAVSATPYASLRRLDGFMRLVAPGDFRAAAAAAGLVPRDERIERLPSGKRFLVSDLGVGESGLRDSGPAG
jgi:SAM-dependent methyltransferase